MSKPILTILSHLWSGTSVTEKNKSPIYSISERVLSKYSRTKTVRDVFLLGCYPQQVNSETNGKKWQPEPVKETFETESDTEGKEGKQVKLEWRDGCSLYGNVSAELNM